MTKTTEGTRKKTGWFPIFLGILVLLIIAGYVTYWFVAASKLRTGIEDWVDQQDASGLDISYSDLRVHGFPFRFIVEFEDPEVINTTADWTWESDSLQLVTQSYNVFHIVAFARDDHEFRFTNGTGYRVRASEEPIASVRLSMDLQPEEIRLAFPRVIADDQGMEFSRFERLNIALRPIPDNESDLQVYLTFKELELAAIGGDYRWLGREIDDLDLKLEIEDGAELLSGNFDLSDWQRGRNEFRIRQGSFVWGPLDLMTEGELRLDEEFRPEGQLEVELRSPEDLARKLPEMRPEMSYLMSELIKDAEDGETSQINIKDRTLTAFGRDILRY